MQHCAIFFQPTSPPPQTSGFPPALAPLRSLNPFSGQQDSKLLARPFGRQSCTSQQHTISQQSAPAAAERVIPSVTPPSRPCCALVICHRNMADVARDVPVPGRDAVPALLRQADGDCGVILMHGSAGDMNSGRLPLYTDALAGAGFPVLRFTIKPPHMPTRVKCCQACPTNHLLIVSYHA